MHFSTIIIDMLHKSIKYCLLRNSHINLGLTLNSDTLIEQTALFLLLLDKPVDIVSFYLVLHPYLLQKLADLDF